MKKEVFNNILRVVSIDFPHIQAGYKQILNALDVDEKAHLESFEPYVKNRDFHRLDIDENSLSIKTVLDDKALTLYIQELPLD